MQKIFIADDHQLFAFSLKLMIEDQTSYEVTNIVANGRELLHTLNSSRPDLLILDINMPELDGMEVFPRIRLLFPAMKIFIVSYLKERSVIHKLKEMGADGYFIKDEDPTVFIACLQAIMEGGKQFPKEKTSAALAEGAAKDPLSRFLFSEREIEVLKLIKLNYTTQQISAVLHLSENTIKTHRKNICKKLNTSDMKQVYLFALEHV